MSNYEGNQERQTKAIEEAKIFAEKLEGLRADILRLKDELNKSDNVDFRFTKSSCAVYASLPSGESRELLTILINIEYIEALMKEIIDREYSWEVQRGSKDAERLILLGLKIEELQRLLTSPVEVESKVKKEASK